MLCVNTYCSIQRVRFGNPDPTGSWGENSEVQFKTSFLSQLGNKQTKCTRVYMRGSRGGLGGSGPPLEFAKLNIADNTGNEKLIYFSYLCTSIVIHQGWTPPWKNFLDPRLSICIVYMQVDKRTCLYQNSGVFKCYLQD